MEKVAYDNPLLRFPETATNLKRADDVLAAAKSVNNFSPKTERKHFTIPRSAEYFDKNELEKQTGQSARRFGNVVIKELLDNALDACDGLTDARVTVRINPSMISVHDTGAGLPAEVVEEILDFNTRTSDKFAYRSPSRGAQGNALKTLLGIATLCGGHLTVESCGHRHHIKATATPLGTVDIQHNAEPRQCKGTMVSVYGDHPEINLRHWLYGYALVNPHVEFVGFEQK